MFIDVLCALRADGSIRFTLNNKKRSRHARKGALFDCRQQTQEFADTGKSVSGSIENQISLIKEYCAKRELIVAAVFQDDGWSGGNFVEVR